MAPRFLTIITGRNLPKIRQPREPEPSIINEKSIADFTRVVEQTGILELQKSPGECRGLCVSIVRKINTSLRPAHPSGSSREWLPNRRPD
jgi:hypothetical protein